jgi:hypothetical protein
MRRSIVERSGVRSGWVLWLSSLASLVSWPLAAEAVILLPNATFQLQCAGQFSSPTVPGELDCDEPYYYEGPTYSYGGERVGIAEMYVGVPEFDPKLPADLIQSLETDLGDERFIIFESVQIEVSVEIAEADPESDHLVDATASGGVYIYFSAGVNELAPPPFPLDELPVKFRVVGEMRVDGDTGYAQLTVSQSEGGLDWEVVGPGEQAVDVTLDQEFFWVDEVLIFEKSAYCSVWTAEIPVTQTGLSASASCVAVLDPVFEFDQARFDAMYGAFSFPLDQYFEIVYSPNLPIPPATPAVPLLPGPIGVGLLGGALAMTGWWRGRRPRRAS